MVELVAELAGRSAPEIPEAMEEYAGHQRVGGERPDQRKNEHHEAADGGGENGEDRGDDGGDLNVNRRESRNSLSGEQESSVRHWHRCDQSGDKGPST